LRGAALEAPVLVPATLVSRLRALEVSRSLHFGDYGGLPLKLILGALDLVTIVVLASGVYLWVTRRLRRADRLAARPASYE
jgi:uncharacterized iron-regulated membrane protein